MKNLNSFLKKTMEFIWGVIERINHFLFFNDTNLFSVCNICFLLFWSVHLSVNHENIVERDMEGMIQLADNGVYFLLFLAISAAATMVVALSFVTRKAVFANGYALLLSGFAWAVIAGAYISDYPPFTPQMGMYAIYSLFCIIAGRKMISTSNKMRKMKCSNMVN